MENGEDDEAYLLKNSETLSQEDKDLLNLYHSTFDDDKVDIDLIVCLLIKIHSLPQPGIIAQCKLFLGPLPKIISLLEFNTHISLQYYFECRLCSADEISS